MSQSFYTYVRTLFTLLTLICTVSLFSACNHETQNRFSRSLQNWTGTKGILEIYAGDKMIKRFLEINKLSTAKATESHRDRPYRFGYGILDENQNGLADQEEKKVYFEFSDYSTSYIFYESPRPTRVDNKK